MSTTFLDMAVSLDGFISGSNDEDGGLHTWYFAPSAGSKQVIEELMSRIGAIVMGRRAFEAGNKHDAYAENPYKVPHFVLSHTPPQQQPKGDTEFIFVADGIERALRQARAAAGERDVCVAGGADIAQQCLRAGLLDELQLHLVPLLLGQGIRLFDHLGGAPLALEQTRVIAAAGVTHVRYRVVR